MNNYKYEVIDCDSEAYPNKLKEIENPPKKLYLAGDISLLYTESVAIVGSRKFTAYGREISKIIIKCFRNMFNFYFFTFLNIGNRSSYL